MRRFSVRRIVLLLAGHGAGGGGSSTYAGSFYPLIFF